MRQTTSRGAILAETLLSTCSRPKYLSRLDIWMMGVISTISSCEASLNNALNISQNDRHDPIKNSRHDERFQIVELSASHSCSAPHHFMNKTSRRNERRVFGHRDEIIANRRDGKT